MKKIAIYGGTFSPPHFGHINLLKGITECFDFDKIFVIPSFIPPHKSTKESANALQRFDMARLAFSYENGIDEKKIEISDYEISKGDISYTYHTVEHFKKYADEIYLFCGTDMLLTFDKWYRFDSLFKSVTLVYARRESDSEIGEKIAKKVAEYTEKYGAKIKEMKYPVFEISSSEIRQAMKNGDEIFRYLPENVIRYINEKGLYQ